MVRLLVQTGDKSGGKELLLWYRKYACYKLPILQEGQCLKMIGEPKEALKLYKETLLKWPDWIELMVEAGILYKQLGEFEKSVAIFERALALAPAKKDVFVQLIHSLTLLGRHNEARKLLMREHNEKGLSIYQHGLCLKHLGELKEALRFFMIGAENGNENFYVCLLQAAEILTDQSRFVEAIKVYENAIKISPTDYKAKIKKIFLLAKAGCKDKALSDLSSLRNQHFESLLTLPYEYGRCLDALGCYEDAQTILAKVPADNINYYDALNLMGCAQAALKNYDAALNSFRMVVAACPERFDVWIRICDIYRYLHRYEDALRIIDEVADSIHDSQILVEKRNKIIQMISQ